MKRNNFFSLAVIIALIFTLALWSQKINSEKIFVNFLDVGQGDAILLRKGNFDLLVDGGPDQAVLSKLGRFRPAGDRKIDIIVLTHPDQDHLGGLLYIINKYDVGAVVLPRIIEKTKNYNRFLRSVKEKNIPLIFAHAGQEIIYESMKLVVFSPDEKMLAWGKTNINNASIVSRVVLPGISLLLTGDTEAPAENFLAKKYGKLLASDILKVGHHGSKTSSSAILLDLVKPQMAIISVAEKNLFGHPHQQTLKRLRGIKIERTDRMGTVTLESDVKTGVVKLRCERECSL